MFSTFRMCNYTIKLFYARAYLEIFLTTYVRTSGYFFKEDYYVHETISDTAYNADFLTSVQSTKYDADIAAQYAAQDDLSC